MCYKYLCYKMCFQGTGDWKIILQLVHFLCNKIPQPSFMSKLRCAVVYLLRKVYYQLKSAFWKIFNLCLSFFQYSSAFIINRRENAKHCMHWILMVQSFCFSLEKMHELWHIQKQYFWEFLWWFWESACFKTFLCFHLFVRYGNFLKYILRNHIIQHC